MKIHFILFLFTFALLSSCETSEDESYFSNQSESSLETRNDNIPIVDPPQGLTIKFKLANKKKSEDCDQGFGICDYHTTDESPVISDGGDQQPRTVFYNEIHYIFIENEFSDGNSDELFVVTEQIRMPFFIDNSIVYKTVLPGDYPIDYEGDDYLDSSENSFARIAVETN